MKKKLKIVALLGSLLLTGSAFGQELVVNLTPDEVPAALFNSPFFSSLNNTAGPGTTQQAGDSFELTEPMEITGGACFGTNGGGFGTFGVGSELQFGVLTSQAGLPTPTAVINETCVVDLYDTVGVTMFQPNNVADQLRRYHVTLANPVILQPGIYFFTLPGTNDDPQIFVGNGFIDNIFYSGSTSNIDLDFGAVSGFDMYFQLEGDPVSTTLLGDVNLDGVVNFADIAPFIGLLQSGDFQAEADVNLDEAINFLDIAGFISLLS